MIVPASSFPPITWRAEASCATSSRKGLDLARCIAERDLWSSGPNQAVLLDASACSPGLYSGPQVAADSGAVVSEEEDESRSAEALLELLGQLCHDLGREAHCVLICERRRLHGLRFRQSVWSSGGPRVPDEALKRVHVKYVLPPAALGDIPPLFELLVGLQNLPFVPAAIAILGLTSLTSTPSSASTSNLPGAPGNPAACYIRPSLIGAAAADARHFALGAALLLDAVGQASDSQKDANFCRAILWDDSAPPEGSAQAVAQHGLLGSSFDGLWSVGWKACSGGAMLPFAEILGRSPVGRL